MAQNSYRQTLPALGLSIERFTESVPGDGAWYLLRDGIKLGRFASLKAAQKAWREVVADSGWTASARPIDGRDALLKESRERWARNRGG